MNKKLVWGLAGLGVLVVAAGVVTAALVVKGKEDAEEVEEEVSTDEVIEDAE